jgi:hypothetical protein
MSASAALRLPDEMLHARPEQKDERSTHFVFEHKLFTVPDVYFALTADRKPAFHINYGDLCASIETRSLRRGFSIEPQSADDRMLSMVERSLRFVRRIRPNDSIPREVLDGTASWAADERHQAVAHGRLTIQLASWMTGSTTTHIQREQISGLANSPVVVARVQKAVGEIAERIGLEADQHHVVVDRIAAFAKELSYVEAIRERFEGARAIQQKVASLLKLYKTDRFIGDNLLRVAALMREPIGAFDVIFGKIDAMIADILAICQSYEAKVVELRTMRDDLFELYLLWEPILTRWHEQPIAKGKFTEESVRLTFQFLARNYPQQSTWKRG